MSDKPKEIVEGNGIAGLFPTPSTEIIEIEYKDKTLKFEIMPLDNETFAQIGDKIKISDVDLERTKNIMAGMKVISDLYYPAIKVVLPKSCVNPKVVDGVSSDPTVLSVSRIPLEVSIELFDRILMTSGIIGQKAEDRKK